MNGRGHFNDDELLDRLYGLAEEDAHLETCADCARRFEQMRERRASVAAPEEVPSGFLAAQRRKIYARLGEQPRRRMGWVPAVGAACLLAVGVFMYRPAPAPPLDTAADEQLFSDVYSIEQSTEPIAAAPIHDLFEDNQ
jgi:hypothetical protein